MFYLRLREEVALYLSDTNRRFLVFRNLIFIGGRLKEDAHYWTHVDKNK